jgi:hypothetical protein
MIGGTAGALRRRSTMIHNENPFLKKMEKSKKQRNKSVSFG